MSSHLATTRVHDVQSFSWQPAAACEPERAALQRNHHAIQPAMERPLETQVGGAIALRATYAGTERWPIEQSQYQPAAATAGSRSAQPAVSAFCELTLNGPHFSEHGALVEAILKSATTTDCCLVEYSFNRAIGTESYQNPTNYNDSRGNLTGLRRHVLVTSYVYDLPSVRADRSFPVCPGRPTIW